jgi:hypothetical protein
VSHVSLGSWLHKQNSRGAWQLRWATLDGHGKLHYWRSKPNDMSVPPAGAIDVSNAVIHFDGSSARAGVFVIKSNQKEVAFQADTLEAASQWVNELKESSSLSAGDDDNSHHMSALSTPFADEHKQKM